MMNLGQKVEGTHDRENGREDNKKPEDKMEGEKYTACYLGPIYTSHFSHVACVIIIQALKNFLKSLYISAVPT